MRRATRAPSDPLAIAVLGKGGRKRTKADVMHALGGDARYAPYADRLMRAAYAPTVPPDKLYDRIRAVLPALEREKAKIASDISQARKLENLDAVLSEGVFYYCTEHPKPADDHAPYQGKIYVSRHWRERVPDRYRASVAEYVARYGIREAEWVTNGPVWLVKRRNCTHRLFRIPLEAVLSGSWKKPRPSVLGLEEGWQARKYRRRYESLEALRQAMPGVARLEKDADRAKLLYKKWARR